MVKKGLAQTLNIVQNAETEIIPGTNLYDYKYSFEEVNIIVKKAIEEREQGKCEHDLTFVKYINGLSGQDFMILFCKHCGESFKSLVKEVC